jgi:hypothetical protein
VLAAVGYNFSLLLRWLGMILRTLITMLDRFAPAAQTVWESLNEGSSRTTIECSPIRDWCLSPHSSFACADLLHGPQQRTPNAVVPSSQ